MHCSDTASRTIIPSRPCAWMQQSSLVAWAWHHAPPSPAATSIHEMKIATLQCTARAEVRPAAPHICLALHSSASLPQAALHHEPHGDAKSNLQRPQHGLPCLLHNCTPRARNAGAACTCKVDSTSNRLCSSPDACAAYPATPAAARQHSQHGLRSAAISYERALMQLLLGLSTPAGWPAGMADHESAMMQVQQYALPCLLHPCSVPRPAAGAADYCSACLRVP